MCLVGEGCYIYCLRSSSALFSTRSRDGQHSLLSYFVKSFASWIVLLSDFFFFFSHLSLWESFHRWAFYSTMPLTLGMPWTSGCPAALVELMHVWSWPASTQYIKTAFARSRWLCSNQLCAASRRVLFWLQLFHSSNRCMCVLVISIFRCDTLGAVSALSGLCVARR